MRKLKVSDALAGAIITAIGVIVAAYLGRPPVPQPEQKEQAIIPVSAEAEKKSIRTQAQPKKVFTVKGRASESDPGAFQDSLSVSKGDEVEIMESIAEPRTYWYTGAPAKGHKGLTASGDLNWNYDPDHPQDLVLKEQKPGSLIACINNGEPFPVGTYRKFFAAQNGMLKFKMNDSKVSSTLPLQNGLQQNGYSDNEGEIKITVSVTKAVRTSQPESIELNSQQ